MRTLRTFTSAVAVAGLAALPLSKPSAAQDLSKEQSEFVYSLPPQAWLSVTEKTERGHRIGKPEAE
ncbi:MAG: hypothetical protein AAF692_10990, partial [Pseudomonadota bacterium]